MPDLLTHALIAFTLCLVLSWKFSWISKPYITAGMAGAFIPDISKLDLVVQGVLIERITGIPFDWFALHTGGAALLSVFIGGLIVVPSERRRVVVMLSIGAVSHLLADGFLITATGYSYPLLWPLTQYSPPTPGLYLSTDPEPMFFAASIALMTWLYDRSLNFTRPNTP